MKFLKYTYTLYAGLIFIISCFFFLPLLILGGMNKKWHHPALKLNYYWAHIYMWIVGLPPKITWKYRPKKTDRAIICANHFSYFDIPVMALLPLPFKFIGKSSIAGIPIFGYMFKKLHIMVNRSSLKSRAESMKHAQEAVSDGFNMVFFPEGGVVSMNPPKMVNFRDGAFRLAIEQNLPVLPVTLLNNYKILPDDGEYCLRLYPLELIIHSPVYPIGNDDQAIKKLKEEVFGIIQAELDRHHNKSN